MSSNPSESRRHFLKASSAALAGSTLAPLALGGVHSAGSDVLKVGLIGCGGRGTGAAANAMRADPQTQLYAMGDAFSDQLNNSLNNLKKQDFADRINVPEERCFVGFDAYKQVIDACDVVLLATSPHFRPMHLEACLAAGRHVFCEKPVAVDGPGLRRVLEVTRAMKASKLNLVSGLCYRYQFAKQETIKRIHDGAIGDVKAMQCTYNTGGLWHRGHQPHWSDMEYQMRNWLYFYWLSADHAAEQHIHSLDKLLWAMNDEPPVKCTASGGRSVRTEEKYGNVFDHFNTVFEWKDGLRGFSSCRQWVGCKSDVSDYLFGTKGRANIQRHSIEGEAGKWRHRGEGPDDMYQNEHNALFAAIRAGEAINNGEYMCKSTLMALMVRMSAYTGQEITWEQALNSQEDLTPPAYDWISLEPAPVSRPGITKFA